MLRLVNIKKNYKVADTKVEALKGISLAFRKSEFVSILGPSGCGKTTTLNIIGGLDKYSSGDLFINGRSTKNFNSHDWDVYRNHRVGFVFQSYNLIQHQTVLSNVELALTIAGMSKAQREEKAKKALDQVGLSGQYYKKPNQLSGGQCQRVAIARALVNEPEILLADEPTGALDTKTSVQIMDLIKEISKDKLVIMVTHNPDLASKYSTRIIKLLDGEVQDDSNPYSFDDEKLEESSPILNEKAKMSWWTAFKLSAKNLMSKKKRTALVSIAGSIGIIGVSMVLSISTGVNDYITSMQDDMLSGNPIQVSESAYDLSTIMGLMTTSQKADLTKKIVAGEVNVDNILDQVLETMNKSQSFSISNDINKNYIDYVKNMPKDYYSDISENYGYELGNNIYTEFTEHGNNKKVYSLNSIIQNYESVLSKVDGIGSYSNYITSLVTSIGQLPAHNQYIETQYDLLDGHLPTNQNEILLVLNSNDKVSDLVLAELGYFTQDEFITYAKNAKGISSNESGVDHLNDRSNFPYDEILNHKMYYVPNEKIYTSTGESSYTTKVNNFEQKIPYPTFNYMNELDNEFINDLSNNKGIELKISGIIKPKKGVTYGCLKSGFYYTEELSKKFYLDTQEDIKRNTFVSTNDAALFGEISQKARERTLSFSAYIDKLGTAVNSNSISTLTYNYHYYDYSQDEIKLVENQIGYVGETNQISALLSSMGGSAGALGGLTDVGKTITKRYIGDVETPTSLYIYPTSFDEKNKVTDYLDLWNNEHATVSLSDGTNLDYSQRSKVTYTDNVGVIIGMVRTLINIVTGALIAFTALSLVVSCFMIAIITYVSVIERVKEIGVIRSLGGRKKDVSHLFNAETFIIGTISGLFGLIVTALGCVVLNIIMNAIAGVSISALYWYHIVIMMALSIGLTVISGLIPARSAARQDPVNALRSE